MKTISWPFLICYCNGRAGASDSFPCSSVPEYHSNLNLVMVTFIIAQLLIFQVLQALILSSIHKQIIFNGTHCKATWP